MAQDVIINNVRYEDVPSITIPRVGSGAAVFYDTTDATAAAADILDGATAYGAGGAVAGNIPRNGATGGTIATKAGAVTIPAGYTTGGSVTLAPAAIADCVSGSILSGKTILGVAGGLTVPTISQDATTKVLSIS